MECYYHPDRESTNKCAICGKSICEECGLKIAGKVYCKDCLEKIVGVGVASNETGASEPIPQDPVETKPAEENIYQAKEEKIDFETPYAPQEEITPAPKIKGISEDSPYNIRSNIEPSSALESSYLDEPQTTYQNEQPQTAQNEIKTDEQVLAQKINEDDFIYPDHSYEPAPTSARLDLEDKYEKYLDDLYFDENDIPLGEQLAKDEAQYGSLTRKEYVPKPKEEEQPEVPEPVLKEEVTENKLLKDKETPKAETPEETEARIRAEILKEYGLVDDKNSKSMVNKEEGNIHNLNYQDGKEPMGILDIILSIILIIVVLIVLYYLIYLFILNTSYPTFLDALFALKNPQNVINAILTH